MEPLVTSRTDWTPELLATLWEYIDDIGKNDLKLDYYEPQFEVISAEQMIDAYASVGMPISYNHWSFGKEFLKNWNAYQKGHMGLAYEIVVNTNPCIAYLMEENNAITQTLVMAHASVGHSFVFKNNFLFKEWTNASAIINYMSFAKTFIHECELKYGVDEVELVLDAAHALANHGVDHRKRKHKKRVSEEGLAKEAAERDDEEQKNLDIIRKKTTFRVEEPILNDEDLENVGDEENLIYFIYKNAPNLEQWKREVLRIVYKIHQYFYPQGQCVTGEHLVSTGSGLLRLDEIISADGYNRNDTISLLTKGDKFTPISHTYLKRQAEVVRITTATGRVYTGTKEHPLMTLNGSSHELKHLGNMVEGDHLVLNTGYTNVFATTEYKLEPVQVSETVTCDICGLESSFLPTHITQSHGIDTADYSGRLSSDMHRANKSVNYPSSFPTSINERMGELVAYLQSMTRPNGNGNVYSCGSTIPFDRFSDIIGHEFGINLTNPAFSSWGLRQFFDTNFSDLDAPGIPKCIRMSPRPVVISYLRALIDVKSIKRQNISTFKFRTYDETMIQQLQTMLCGLGIIATARTEQWTTFSGMAEMFGMEHDGGRLVGSIWCLEISPSYRAEFERIVGSNLLLSPFTGNARVCSKNLIPGGAKLLADIVAYVKHVRQNHHAENSGMTYAQKKQQSRLINQQDIPRLQDLPQLRAGELSFEDVHRQRPAFALALSLPIPAAVELRELLANSDQCFYDKIVSVETLDELHDVYDVTVPENHLFWMDGLISHNTKTLNEGFATFTHYYIMQELEKKGIISPDAQISWLQQHSGVVYQPAHDSPHYSGFNPYALGFSIFKEIRRVCEEPTDEDREWFPQLVGTDWREAIKDAAANYRDESFIEQFLTPKLMRELRLFSVQIDDEKGIVKDVSDEKGYRQMRSDLAASYNRISYYPEITVKSTKMKGDRTLTLQYKPFKNRALHKKYAEETLQFVKLLWGYDVEIIQREGDVDFQIFAA